MRKIWIALVLSLTFTACSGNARPAQPGTPSQKLTALKAAEVSQITLVQAVHAEASICDPVKAKADPTAPILECAGPLAVTAKLTTERHREFSARMLKAFETHKDAVERLNTWKPGEPIPVNVSTLQTQVEAILSLSKGLGGDDAAALSNIVSQVLKQIADIRAALGR